MGLVARRKTLMSARLWERDLTKRRARQEVPHGQSVFDRCCVQLRAGWGSICPDNLLSDHIGIVACLDLEGAVVGPDIDGHANASNATLVDLNHISACSRGCLFSVMSHHLCGLGATNCKLEVRIFLPVTEKERKLRKKSIVCVSGSSDGLWAGISV